MARPQGPCSTAELEQRRVAAQNKRPSRKPRRWKGQELAELRSAYELGAIKVDILARYFGTSRGQMMRLARHYSWKRRQPPPLPEAARRHRYLYSMAKKHGGRAFALEVVAGMA